MAVVLLGFGCLGLVVLQYVRYGATPFTLWTGGMFTCIVIHLSPLSDSRRRLKVVQDVLGEVVRNGFSLARSLEHAALWDCILTAGSMHPISAEDLRVQDGGLGWFHEIVGVLHDRLSDFIHRVVVLR